jgi:alanine-synthesizing transaminase
MLTALIDIARRHQLLLLSDEIYDKVIYDDAVYTPIASLADDVFTLTFSGLSKSYRAAGLRTGWMVVSGPRATAGDLIEGLEMLASLRLCSNVPGQYAVQTALGGIQSIDALVNDGGRLREQRDLAHSLLLQIPGVSCVKPRGALYLFPKLDPKRFNIRNDEQLVLDLLRAERVLLVHGRGFNWPEPDHLRLVFLPGRHDLREAINRIARFLDGYQQP